MSSSPEKISPNTLTFDGLRVIAFESRMAAETAAIIDRFGGRPTVAPAMREVPLEDNHAALEFGARLIAGRIDVMIFLTGVGARELFRVLETRYSRERLLTALAGTMTVARGPKPVATLREFGLDPTLTIPEPNTWREILAATSQRTPLDGKCVGVQEYGISNRELIAGLEARGAEVVAVPVYRWTLPEDRAPLCAAAAAIAAGDADVVLFTSSAQVTNVMQVADAAGIGEQFRAGLSAIVVASIGPVCSAALRAHGATPDFEPDHPKLGHLIKEAAARSAAILSRKRGERPLPRVTVLSQAAAPPAVAASTSESGDPSLAAHPLMRACRREQVPYTPVWLMRQAGRYMPEYRRVRGQYSFLEMCRQPELAAEVTVTAVERLGVDAAIIFADILLPLMPMGVGLSYEAGDGPTIERPVRTASDLTKILPVEVNETLGFVGAAIRLVRRALPHKPLIGFAGAPFTLASYLVEGGSSRQYQATKTLMYTDPDTWHRMMDLLAGITVQYLNMQVEAGADLVQLFDSWVGSLGPDDYRRFVLPHTRRVIAGVRPGVPVIHFGTVTGNLLELMREAGGDVIGLDWRVDLDEAWARVGHDIAVQGNLDPVALFADRVEIKRRTREILDRAGGRPGHIFNLGHGILPNTPVDNVIALVDAVHELSAR
ncbi:MAG TPA: uroporphyrinogen decarboxylase [Candidatus Binataceae bacterium]|nr:uroporphyrinogen decarboxylase [Candidatus Binataceae bacterium]